MDITSLTWNLPGLWLVTICRHKLEFDCKCLLRSNDCKLLNWAKCFTCMRTKPYAGEWSYCSMLLPIEPLTCHNCSNNSVEKNWMKQSVFERRGIFIVPHLLNTGPRFLRSHCKCKDHPNSFAMRDKMGNQWPCIIRVPTGSLDWIGTRHCLQKSCQWQILLVNIGTPVVNNFTNSHQWQNAPNVWCRKSRWKAMPLCMGR